MTMKKYRGILVVGGTGSGKTTFIKKYVVNNYKGTKYIFDINNEYKEGLMMPMEKFLGAVKGVSNSLIIFEEATIFFSNKGDVSALRYLLVSKRHRNNIILFTFHSLQSIPLNIFSLCDLLVLHKTNDNVGLIERKYGQHVDIYDAFVELSGSPHRFDRRAVKLR